MTVIIGIDPHKASHTAVAIGCDETAVGRLITVQSDLSADGSKLLGLGRSRFGPAHLGRRVRRRAGLPARPSSLSPAGETTSWMCQATLTSRVRVLTMGRSNKNDPNDALSVAVAALRFPRAAPRVVPVGHGEVLRLLAKRNTDIGRLRNISWCPVFMPRPPQPRSPGGICQGTQRF